MLGKKSRGELTTRLILANFRANGLLLAAGDRLVAADGMTSARWQVMGAVALAGQPQTVPQIARRMGLTRQSVHVSVGRLVSDGLMELLPNAGHRRSQLVAFTGSGDSLYRLLDRRQAVWATEISGGIDPGDIEIAFKVLEKLSAVLDSGTHDERDRS